MGERVFNSTLRLNSAGPIDWDLGAGNSTEYDIEYAWVSRIPDYAFSAGVNFRQSYLTSIAFPDTITEIGVAAFKGAGIKQVILPSNLKVIEDEAFYYTALLDLEVPASVTSVGSRAFGFNTSLNSAILRFKGNLKPVEVPNTGWFFGCLETLTPVIPKVLMDPTYLTAQYGAFWNVYAYNQDTGEIFTLSYSGE